MMFVNAFDAALSEQGIILVLLFLLLTTFILYLLYANDKSSDTDRKRLISKLPSATKNLWTMMRFSLKIGFLNTNELLNYFDNLVKRIGPVVHYQVLNRDYVFIMDPDDIKALLSSNQHITKGPEYKPLEPWLNEGLLTSTDQKWQSRRKMLTNSFHFKVLETYLPSINRHSRLLIKILIAASENGNKPIVDVKSYVTRCALDIIGGTIMGVNLRTQEGKSAYYVKAIKNVSRILIKRIFTFWYWNDFIFYSSKLGRDFLKSLKLLHEYTENVIKERREILENTGPKKNEENERKRVYSFLDLLIIIAKENPGSMTDKDIREEVDTFLFEGHDTSSIVLTMAIMLLGLNQNIQNAVRDELYEIFGNSNRDAVLEDLKAMSTLERVIKETMRLYPSVTGFTRQLNESLQLKNYTVPAGSIVAVAPYLLHRVETLFPDPEKFDPDRFTPERCAKRHPYAYIPFSAGSRNCIGQKYVMHQIKIVLSTVLRNARVETLGELSEIVVSPELILRVENLPSVMVTPMNDNNPQFS